MSTPAQDPGTDTGAVATLRRMQIIEGAGVWTSPAAATNDREDLALLVVFGPAYGSRAPRR